MHDSTSDAVIGKIAGDLLIAKMEQLPSVPRSCEAGLDPETLSLRASLEFIAREFARPGAGS